MGDKAGWAFAKMLKKNTTLQDLDIGHTDLEQLSLIKLGIALRKNSTLTALNVDEPNLVSYQARSPSPPSPLLLLFLFLFWVSFVNRKKRRFTLRKR
jgi:hypothetical protein